MIAPCDRWGPFALGLDPAERTACRRVLASYATLSRPAT